MPTILRQGDVKVTQRQFDLQTKVEGKPYNMMFLFNQLMIHQCIQKMIYQQTVFNQKKKLNLFQNQVPQAWKPFLLQ